MLKLGNYLKEKRENANYSQIQLGKLCGVSETTICNLETGKTQKPDCNLLCKIAQNLNVSKLEIMLAAGYIDENDLNPKCRLNGVENLTSDEIRAVQPYIDYLNSRKSNKKLLQGSNENAV